VRFNSRREQVRLGLSVGHESEGRGLAEWEAFNGYGFMLPVDPFNVAACGEAGMYTGRPAVNHGVLPAAWQVRLGEQSPKLGLQS
jgi:hypothetical protein